jgi:hypothetical protein
VGKISAISAIPREHLWVSSRRHVLVSSLNRRYSLFNWHVKAFYIPVHIGRLLSHLEFSYSSHWTSLSVLCLYIKHLKSAVLVQFSVRVTYRTPQICLFTRCFPKLYTYLYVVSHMVFLKKLGLKKLFQNCLMGIIIYYPQISQLWFKLDFVTG